MLVLVLPELRSRKECGREQMKTEEQVRKHMSVLHETLAGLYGKDMPYAEERLAARIDEDEWFLNDTPTNHYCPECLWDNPDRVVTDQCPSCGGPLVNMGGEKR